MADETRVRRGSDDATEPRPELVVYSTAAGRFPLPARDEVLLGRDPDNDVVLADPAVSRRHCRLKNTSGGWWLEDLGSQSGTRVDGALIAEPVPLAPGSWFQIGDSWVQLATSALAAPGGPLALSGDPPRDAFLLAELAAALSALAAADGLDDILRRAIRHGLRVAGAERGAVFLAQDGGGLEVAVACDPAGNPLPLVEGLTRSLPRRALEHNQALVITDVADPLAAEVPESLCGSLRRAAICVPIPSARGGVLYLDSVRPAPSFGTGELAILSTLALHAGLALDRAQDSAQSAARRHDLERENARLRAHLGGTPRGSSPAFERALEMIRRLAPADVTVCLQGETGTGKEVLARYLHQRSPRAARPFVVVDCGALPAPLIESELFGFERGAFTGAHQARAGRLREAAGGTVFLDEIGELPLELQPRLLRFLQERTVQPIGGRAVPVDVRVVCATHRDLEEDVRRGTLRQDLYFRLAVVTVPVPPLREREEDVLLLAEHCLAAHGGPAAVARLGHDARRALVEHPWPGNVRELEHRVVRALLLAPGAYLTAVDLGLAEPTAGAPPLPDELLPLPAARAQASERFERRYLEEALHRAAGNITSTARLAGVSRQVIHGLMQRHGLQRDRFQPE